MIIQVFDKKFLTFQAIKVSWQTWNQMSCFPLILETQIIMLFSGF